MNCRVVDPQSGHVPSAPAPRRPRDAAKGSTSTRMSSGPAAHLFELPVLVGEQAAPGEHGSTTRFQHVSSKANRERRARQSSGPSQAWGSTLAGGLLCVSALEDALATVVLRHRCVALVDLPYHEVETKACGLASACVERDVVDLEMGERTVTIVIGPSETM